MDKPPWRPRASKLGAYFGCLWRALHDRLEYEGRLPAGTLKDTRDNTSYADLGDCIHFTLQDGARCTFAPQAAPEEEDVRSAAEHFGSAEHPKDFREAMARTALGVGDPRAHQPTAAQWSSASTLFGGDMPEVAHRVRQAASLALTYLPTCPAGEAWIAEQMLETEYLTGHMDFLSRSWEDGVDLKTTSQKPVGQKVKMDHLYQMVGYHLLTGRRLKRCPVLYVDSQDASWAVLVPIDLTTEPMQFLADQVESFCRFLMSDQLLDVAVPMLGDHCHRSWCSWQPGCKNWFAPPAGRYFPVAKQRTPVGPIKTARLGR